MDDSYEYIRMCAALPQMFQGTPTIETLFRMIKGNALEMITQLYRFKEDKLADLYPHRYIGDLTIEKLTLWYIIYESHGLIWYGESWENTRAEDGQ